MTLALAIGANSVVFGVLNALILRPLKVNKRGELVLPNIALKMKLIAKVTLC